MNAKTRRAREGSLADARTPAAGPASPWGWAADLSRQQLAVANESTGAVLRGLAAMRKIHEDTTREASRRHAAAAQQLRGQVRPVDVVAAQADLLRGDFEAAANYWQQITATALEMNTEVLGCAAHLVDSDVVLAAAHGHLPQS